MSDERIRVGIVGLGIGRAHLLACLDQRRHYRLVTVCDTDADLAADVATWADGVEPSTSLDQVLARDDIDVVSLCTPPFLHREQIERCLRAGKDVFCEKPLVGSVRQVDELAAVAAETGRTVMPILQYRFGRGIQRLRRLVDAGLAGRPYVTNIDLAWSRGPDYYAAPWRGRWETELGGTIVSHASHHLDMTMFVLGPPSSVVARTATLVNPVETEDSAAVILRWADGSLATLSATTGSVAEISRQRFTFQHLSAESGTEPYDHGADPWTYTPADTEAGERVARALAAEGIGASGDHQDEPVGSDERRGPAEPGGPVADGPAPSEPEGYYGQFAGYAAARATGLAPPVTLDDSRRLLELITAIYVSAAEEREVPMPLADDDPALEGWRR